MQQNNPNVSSSSLSDASQLRYQKAVKEISKLIGMNNSVKRDAENFRIMCENLQIQNRQLFQGYEEAVKEKNNLEQKVREYESKTKQLEIKIQNLQKRQQSQITQAMFEDYRKKHQQELNIYHQKLDEQGSQMIRREEVIAQLQKENKELKGSIQGLKDQLQKLYEQKNKKVSFGECVKCPQSGKKLRQAIEWRQKVQQENLELKKKMAYIETRSPQTSNKNYRGDERDRLIESLKQQVRTYQQLAKKKKIQNCRNEQKIEKLKEELSRIKGREKILQTTTLENVAGLK